MSANGSRMGSFAAARALAAVLAAVLSCLCAGLAATLSPQQAFAADQEPTLTVVVKYGSGSSAVSIDGMKLDAYEVARIGNNGYELLDAYSSTGYDFNRALFDDADEMIAAASKVEKLASKQSAAASATTGTDGKAAFGTLEPGVYLIVQSGASGSAAKYETIDSYLINVPQITSDGTVYDVVSSPKPAPKPTEEPEPSKSSESPNPSTTTTTTTTTRTTPSTNSSMAKTNDNIDWRITALCAGIGLAALGTAIFASRKLKR